MIRQSVSGLAMRPCAIKNGARSDAKPDSTFADRAPAALGPPERFFGFVDDVAPGQADVVQVALGPVGQLAALVLPIPPNMQGFADLGPEAGTMMISHRFMGAGGHGRLLKLISAQECLPSDQ